MRERVGVVDTTGHGEYSQEVEHFLSGRREALPDVLGRLQRQQLSAMAGALVRALKDGGKILVAGNGGSAAEAQHFAAELVGRFMRDRPAYRALCLNTDTSILTALANDYSFEDVFARQVEALAERGDVFVAYSTSGESENLIRAAHAARARGARVLALTGGRASRLASAADLAVMVPSSETPIVQEVHLMITHLVCGIAETELAGHESGASAEREEP